MLGPEGVGPRDRGREKNSRPATPLPAFLTNPRAREAQGYGRPVPKFQRLLRRLRRPAARRSPSAIGDTETRRLSHLGAGLRRGQG